MSVHAKAMSNARNNAMAMATPMAAKAAFTRVVKVIANAENKMNMVITPVCGRSSGRTSPTSD